jgi:uncharacterized protein involved in type VI secretion and phage assembly
MAITLYQSGDERERGRGDWSITSGIVENNCDSIMQGKVLVRIPSMGLDVWARMVAPGAGSNRGLLFTPQVEDEVLVALNQDDPNDAFVLGGLWNNRDRIPESSPPEILSRRTLRTGLVDGVAHELTFDDAGQSITITGSTRHRVTVGPNKIELHDPNGQLTITMDTVARTISISAPAGAIELKAPKISLNGTAQLELKGAKVDIQATGPCSIQGAVVKIN